MNPDMLNEQGYLNLLQWILDHGEYKDDRTGTGTLSCFGAQLRFTNIAEQFPLFTTKKVHLKSIIHELLWFISGDTNVKYLQDNKVTIWDEWATEAQTAKFNRPQGELGPIYGHQWRNFGATMDDSGHYRKNGFDQISWVINEIKTNPNSRRLIVTGWNPIDADQVTLPPCHTLFQFFVSNGKLSCQLYQRSSDAFIGQPFNICSYSLLLLMVAQVCNLKVGDFIWTGGDCHIYSNHIDQVREQLSRTPFPAPKMILDPSIDNIFNFAFDSFMLENYQSHPAIKAPIAV